jgi:hypothetical protein
MNPSFFRNYLNKFDKLGDTVLTEASRGLLYRDKGDTFIQGPATSPTATLTFDKVDYFPGQPGEFADYNDMTTQAQQIILNYPGLVYVNSPTNASKAFAILTFDGPQPGQRSYFCRFFQRITNNMAGQWKNSDLPGGWQLTKKSSMKASYGLKPADLFQKNAMFNSPLEVLSALNGNPKVEALIPGLQMLLGGKLPIFDGQAPMLGAIQDDLGETMAPIALIMGMINDKGAQAAKADLLGGNDWRSGKINFPDAKNNGLVDSFIYVDGVEVGISSKGNKGATASIKNVSDGIAIAKSDNSPAHHKSLQKFADQVKLVEEIGNKSALDFPLDYAVQFDIITSAMRDQIVELIKTGAKSLNNLNISQDEKDALERFSLRINAMTTKQNYNMGYHILSVVAKDVAAHINRDPLFGKACLHFVNINPIIQIYLTAVVAKNDVKVTNLKSTYPPNFEGTIMVESTKNYSSTGVGGRFTFAYSPDKNAAMIAAAEEKETARTINAAEKIATAKIDKVLTGHTDVKLSQSSPHDRKDDTPRARRK